MRVSKCGAALAAIAAAFAICACGGSPTTTPSVSAGPQSLASRSNPVDGALTRSILKRLRKKTIIGSTIDPTNGDRTPYGIAIVKGKRGLQPGDILACNFDDKNGNAGAGTTIERFAAASAWKHTSFAQNAALAGCDAVVLDSLNTVFASALTAPDVAQLTSGGALQQMYTKGVHAPVGDTFALVGRHYTSAYLYIADAKTGSILSLSYGRYGTGKITQVATGFAVSERPPPAIRGPSGLQYDKSRDVLYIVDGANNTLVAFSHASDLLVRNEIIVKRGGKTFKCKFPRTTCATLVYAGKPLDRPMASALLPNGNLIVANTKGGNRLVELTPAGKILDTRVVDDRSTAGVFGLAASGTSDDDTALFFTDTNTNQLLELER